MQILRMVQKKFTITMEQLQIMVMLDGVWIKVQTYMDMAIQEGMEVFQESIMHMKKIMQKILKMQEALDGYQIIFLEQEMMYLLMKQNIILIIYKKYQETLEILMIILIIQNLMNQIISTNLVNMIKYIKQSNLFYGLLLIM